MSQIVSSENVRRWHRTKDATFETLSNERVLTILTVVPALTVFLAVNVLPILWAFYASLHDIPSFSPEWTWTGIGNYVAVLEDPAFWDSLWRALIFAGGSTLVQLVAGVGLALLVNRTFKYGNLVRAAALFPYLVPTVFIGFIGKWMLNGSFGIVNQLFLQVGLVQEYVSWYGSLQWAMPAIILTNSWKFTVFVTILVLARLQSIPEGYYEAAQIAGANVFQQFRDITLPNIKGVIFIVVLLRGVFMFNKFDIIWVLTRGGPVDKTTTAPVYAYERAFSSFSLGEAAATAVLLFLILVVSAIVYFTVFEPEEEVRVE